MKRPLHKLTRQEHAVLKVWGFLVDLYPEATGEWDKNSVGPIMPVWDNSQFINAAMWANIQQMLKQVIADAPVISDLYNTPTSTDSSVSPCIPLDIQRSKPKKRRTKYGTATPP